MSDFKADSDIPNPLPRVKFYSAKEAYDLYSKALPKAYFDSFSPAERPFRCQKKFQEWTNEEREILFWYLCRVERILRINAPKMLPRCWNLAKLSRATDPYWDLPFSADKLIILPESVICDAIRAYHRMNTGIAGSEHPYIQQEAHIQAARDRNSSSIVDFFHTLFHELAHVYLRLSCHKAELENIYARNWSMERVCDPAQNLYIAPEYANRLVTNPDTFRSTGTVATKDPRAPNGRKDGQQDRYLFHVQFHGQRKTYLPLYILHPKTGLREAILVEMHEWCSGKWSTTERFHLAKAYRPYTILFNGMTRQLYDPEEILVNLMSDYVVSNVRYIGENPAAVNIYEDIDRLTGKHNAC